MNFKSKRALMLAGGLGGLIRPLLAQDAKFDLGPALTDVSAQSLAVAGAPKALADKVFGLVQPLLAADAALDAATVLTVVEAANGMALDGDDEIPAVAEDADDKAKDKPKPVVKEEKKDPPAMDAAAVAAQVAAAKTEVRAEMSALRTAEREVAPVLGELPAMDSATEVYKAGLIALDVSLDGLPEASYGATFRAIHAATSKAPTIAQDGNRPTAERAADFDKRYPKRTTLVRG